MCNTTPAATAPADLGVTGWVFIEPRELDLSIRLRVDGAMAHATDLNPHRTSMLRDAANPSLAATLYVALTDYAEQQLCESGWPEALFEWVVDHDDLCCWLRRYTVRGLAQSGDELVINAVQTRIGRRRCGFPTPATEDELTFLHHDPVALVRAAYAIARDLSA